MTVYKDRLITDEAPNFERMIKAGIQTELLHTWTALPGIVKSFDATTQTAEIQPAIKQEYINESQARQTRSQPLLINVPVHIPRTSGFAVTLPVAADDEGLIVFCSRCIDSWSQQGGEQPPETNRKHSFSDAIFIPGVFGKPSKLSSYITDGVEMRNAAGDTKITLKDGSIDITAAAITINGTTVTTTAPTITDNATLVDINTTTLDLTATTVIGNAGGTGTIDFTSASLKHNGTNVGDTHTHTQGTDSAGDTEQDTGGPQ
jgi:hypothetical protein